MNIFDAETFKIFFGVNSSWFWSMCQFIIITITLIMVYNQLKSQRKSNMLQTLHKCDDKWDSTAMLKRRSIVASGYASSSLEMNEEVILVINFFEDLGMYFKEGLISKSIIWNSYSYQIEHYWPLLKPRIDEFQAKNNDNSFGEQFKNLHKAMQKYSSSKKLPTLPLSNNQLVSFAKHEESLFLEQKERNEFTIEKIATDILSSNEKRFKDISSQLKRIANNLEKKD